ncbi:hypothetical protein JHK87_021757 [Glycine soja]|nr:hypothetical protein JHK87_021757 [Glycine soja]
MGQRQLFFLGRILLKSNRILVLDEATASIDSATDAIFQSVIKHEFSECSVINVAHRVPTVNWWSKMNHQNLWRPNLLHYPSLQLNTDPAAAGTPYEEI